MDIAEILSECFYRLEDLQSDLRKAKESIVYSPEIIDETIERISLLDRLKKKYGGTIEEILGYKEKIQSKLSEIESDDTRLVSLNDQLNLCQSQLQSDCQNLSHMRKKVAAEMEKHMERELNELNFNDTRLIVNFSPLLDEDLPKYTSSGFDSVEFLIITNKGEDPKPLVKIASGGEISRIMLAFKTILGDFDTIPTLIFDEIDSGISGITASIVGKKMRDIAKGHQILCITHLPQIAAFSQHHYKIYKDETEGRTVSSVKSLSYQEKVQEVARLLGGLHLTETVIKNAEELISQSSK
jgi:DNA repair protein RecN (Recombination protein N)